MDKPVNLNRDLWNRWTLSHVKSKFYDVEGFKKGRCTLDPIEREEVGEVRGKRLLHLQCHFGLDTLSWARLGAKVTGMDFSRKAIEAARALASELSIPAEFICCDLYDLPKYLAGEFDIVFTSGGVLCWLPDMRRWAEVIATFLRSDGLFYIREFHPFSQIFNNTEEAETPVLKYPYFHSDQPISCECEGSYAAPGSEVFGVSYEWTHSLSDAVNALIDAGLRIDRLNEFPFTTYQAFPFLKKSDDGYWRYPGMPDSLPLMFSLKAIKP